MPLGLHQGIHGMLLSLPDWPAGVCRHQARWQAGRAAGGSQVMVRVSRLPLLPGGLLASAKSLALLAASGSLSLLGSLAQPALSRGRQRLLTTTSRSPTAPAGTQPGRGATSNLHSNLAALTPTALYGGGAMAWLPALSTDHVAAAQMEPGRHGGMVARTGAPCHGWSAGHAQSRGKHAGVHPIERV